MITTGQYHLDFYTKYGEKVRLQDPVTEEGYLLALDRGTKLVADNLDYHSFTVSRRLFSSLDK